MSTDYEIYMVLLGGKKLTRSTVKIDPQNGAQSKTHQKKLKNDQKKIKTIYCDWCNTPISVGKLCADCDTSRLNNQFCNVCHKGWQNQKQEKFVQCHEQACQMWVHKECDQIMKKENIKLYFQADSLQYRCPSCRWKLRIQIFDDIIRYFTYFDPEKQLWQLDKNASKYYELIQNPIDFVTIYQKNRDQKYSSESQFINDIKLLNNNFLEFNHTKSHRFGQHIKLIYDILLKLLKPYLSVQDEELLGTDYLLIPFEKITQEMSQQFLNVAFGHSEIVQIMGESNYKPHWEPQLLSISPAIQPEPSEKPLIIWEKTINSVVQFEKTDEALVKLNFAEFCKHQIQQEIKIKINLNKLLDQREDQYFHPYLDYVLGLEPPTLIDESINKPILQAQITKLITKDISKLQIVQPFPMKIQGIQDQQKTVKLTEYCGYKKMLNLVCYACGGYEFLENLFQCCECQQTFHFYCQIYNPHYVPLRVYKSYKSGPNWKCNNCVKCYLCKEQGGKGDLFCCLCNEFCHFKCALPNFVGSHDIIEFWRCPSCFQCRNCETKIMLDLEKLAQMKPSTTSNTLHISVEYFQNFTLCLPCGLEVIQQRFCEFCEEYIQMDIQRELVNPLIPSECQIQGELLNFFFDDLRLNEQRVYLNKEYKPIKSSKQCLKCLCYYHVACLQKNNKKMNENQVCYDCTQDMSQLIFRMEQLKKQKILQQIQIKTIKKIVSIVAGILDFRVEPTKDEQSFIIENLEALDHFVSQFLKALASTEDIKQELTENKNCKDDYIEQLSLYWCCKFDVLEQPQFTSSIERRHIEIEIEKDLFERIIALGFFKQRKDYLITSINTILGQQFLPQGLGQINNLAIDYTCMMSDLQCLFVQNLKVHQYSWVEDNYYVEFIKVLEYYQNNDYLKWKWNLSKHQQILIIPFPNSIQRSIKKIVGAEVLELKKTQYKDTLLVWKGKLNFQSFHLKLALKKISEKFTDIQINDKFKRFHQNQKDVTQSIKEIKQLFYQKFPEIQSRPKVEEAEKIEEEDPKPLDPVIQPDNLLSSPLDGEKCELCRKYGNRTVSGRLLYIDGSRWVHVNCVLWNEDSKENELCVKQLLNNKVNCDHCDNPGATIVCKKCRKKIHFYCGHNSKWHFQANRKVYCYSCNQDTKMGVTNFFIWRRISVQQKQDRQSKQIVRFGNTILISLLTEAEEAQQFKEINLLLVRDIPLYIQLNLQTSILKISQVDQQQFIQESEKDSQIFNQVIQLVLEQNEGIEYYIDSLDDLIQSLQKHGIRNLQNENHVGQLFLLFTQYVRQKLLDKTQTKSQVSNIQFSSFKQWFYLESVVEDLTLEVRTAQIQYLSRIIHNDQSNYDQHPMLYDDGLPKINLEKQNSKLSRKESHMPQLLQPNEILEEAGLLNEESRLDDQYEELEKRLRQDYYKNRRYRLYVAPSHIHKYGLFTKQSIKRGDLVIEYTGEIIRNALADYREIQYNEQGFGDCYMFRSTKNSVIDATFQGSEARFLNHSCCPNCSSLVMDEKILIYAKKNIAACEELTYDYQFEIEAESEKIQCRCGARNCIGRLN